MTATQVRLRNWPGMRLSWLGAGAVVHAGDEPSDGAASLVVTPHGSSECAVVISSHTVKLLPTMVEELAEILANGLPRGFAAMRFVAWDGACTNGDRPAPAHILAMRLGIDVISAAGPLLGVPGGSLFTPVGRGPQRPGGWWRFRPGAMPVRVGWRFPAPVWEADLGEVSDLPGDLILDHVPAGLWLHRRSVGSITDLAYSVPTDPNHPSLILSHPTEAPLRREEIGHGIKAMPALTTDRVVFTPYGQRPLADGPVGPVIADLLGRAVHVRTGLPLCAPAGQKAVVTIDNKGLPRWRTFARELWHAPRAGAPRTVDWVNPAPEVLTVPAGAATFALGSGWVCEIIEAGLWVRPEQLAEPADWIRALPVDVNRCGIVLGAPHAPEITPPGHMIAGVIERMPVDARKRAYLAVPRGAAPNVFVLATALRDRLPEAGDIELIGPSQTVPAPALHPVPPSHPANGRPGLHVAPPHAFHRDVPTSRIEMPTGHHDAPTSRIEMPTGRVEMPTGRVDVPARPPQHGAPPDPRHQARHDVREPRTGDIREPRTGDLREPRTGDIRQPRTGDIREPRPADIREPRTGDLREPRPADIREPRTGDIREPRPIEQRTGDLREPRAGEVRELRTGDLREPRSGEPREHRTGEIWMPSPRLPMRDAPEPPPAPEDPTSSGSHRGDGEIRSHRNGKKPAKRDDDRTSTQELDRLLGFFDEIRRAKAWDE